MGKSNIRNGKCTIVIEQKYGPNLDKQRYVCLKFTESGIGFEVGRFDNPIKTLKKTLLQNLGIDLKELRRTGTEGRQSEIGSTLKTGKSRPTPSFIHKIVQKGVRNMMNKI